MPAINDTSHHEDLIFLLLLLHFFFVSLFPMPISFFFLIFPAGFPGLTWCFEDNASKLRVGRACRLHWRRQLAFGHLLLDLLHVPLAPIVEGAHAACSHRGRQATPGLPSGQTQGKHDEGKEIMEKINKKKEKTVKFPVGRCECAVAPRSLCCQTRASPCDHTPCFPKCPFRPLSFVSMRQRLLISLSLFFSFCRSWPAKQQRQQAWRQHRLRAMIATSPSSRPRVACTKSVGSSRGPASTKKTQRKEKN